MVNNEKRTNKRPGVIYPTKVVKVNTKFEKKLSLVFSYKIVLINVLNSNTDKVFAERICSFCNHNLYYADCYHKRDNLKVSLFRFCHYCKTIFLLTGRFESEEQFANAFEYFDTSIYKKSEKNDGKQERNHGR